MINTNFLQKIIDCYPNGRISEPCGNASYVLDSNGQIIGHFDYGFEAFYLREGYEHKNQAKNVMSQEGLDFELKEYKEFESDKKQEKGKEVPSHLQ